MPTPAVEFRSLTKFYGEHRGIEDVDLVVEEGRAFGFLGPNGAGKTTAMRVMLDLHRATSGEAIVLGFDSRRDSTDVRSRTGYLAGDISLHEKLTASAQLDWLARIRGGVPRRRIDDLADRLGLDLGRRIGDLSKGNRQKVGLVQAFMHEPALLVLDEPTSGLDPLVQHTFQQMVREVVDDGRTVFLSSHIIDEVDRACDEVAIIRQGKLIALETIEGLRARSLREVSITFADDVGIDEFRSLPDVVWSEQDGRRITLHTSGGVDALVKQAAQHTVVDFVSEQADLETVFLEFYGGEQ